MKKGTNSSVMKDRNMRLIINMVHRAGCCRADIAKKTGLTRATVTILTDELIRSGLMTEMPDAEFSGVGRCPLKLGLCSDSVYAVGIALERKGYSMGLYNLSGRAVDYRKEPYSSNDIDFMAQRISEYMCRADGERIIGVGVASPGPVDYKAGRIINPPNFSKWHNCDIVNSLQEKTGLPVYLENISNALAVGQKYFGLCREEENYAYIVVDDGIGSGIVIDGEVYRGRSGYGNELGHTSIAYDGVLCTCGNRGCLECYASIPAVLSGTQYKSWQEAVDSGDGALIEKEAEYLTSALVNLVNLFDLEKIILGGDIAYKGELLAEKISTALDARIITHRHLQLSIDCDGTDRARSGASVALHNLIF